MLLHYPGILRGFHKGTGTFLALTLRLAAIHDRTATGMQLSELVGCHVQIQYQVMKLLMATRDMLSLYGRYADSIKTASARR